VSQEKSNGKTQAQNPVESSDSLNEAASRSSVPEGATNGFMAGILAGL
jgi:hypothetical protein